MQISGVGSAATNAMSGTIAPGSLATIFGSGLASGLAAANSVTLSTSLADVQSVTINNIAAPIRLAAGSQIEVQVPWEVSPGSVTVTVTRTNGLAPVSATVQVASFAPSIFSANFGVLQALATNADGTLVAASGSVPGLTSHPANSGDTITVYAAGLGPVDVPPGTGLASASVTNTMNPVTVLFGGVAGQTMYSGLSQQYVGVYRIDVVVPPGVTANPAVPLSIQVGDVTSSDPVTVAIGGQ